MLSTAGQHLPRVLVRGTHGQLVAFLVLNIIPSHFGLPLLLSIVLFSKKVKRRPTFINFCVVFIIIGISSSLLLYFGRTAGPEPPKMLCLLQASLLYGMPPLASTAAFTLILEVILGFRTAFLAGGDSDGGHPVRLWAMIITPYIAFFTTVLITATIGSQYPSRVSRSRRFFYCSLDSKPLTRTITLFSSIMLIATIITIGLTVRDLYIRWKVTRSNEPPVRCSVDRSFLFRIIGFGIYITIAMSVAFLSMAHPKSPVPDLVISSAAVVVLFIFGTQSDILSVTFFWVSKKKPLRPVLQDCQVDSSRGHISDVESQGSTSTGLKGSN